MLSTETVLVYYSRKLKLNLAVSICT